MEYIIKLQHKYKHKTFEIGKYDLVFSLFILDTIKTIGIQLSHYDTTTSLDIGIWVIDFGIMLWKRNDR